MYFFSLGQKHLCAGVQITQFAVATYTKSMSLF